MSKPILDVIDKKIISLLIKNARMPFLEIARECGVSGAAIHQRVKKLEETGVIIGAHLRIDPAALGYTISAYMGIRISDASFYNTTVESLRQIPEVVGCHFITGKYNAMLKVHCFDNEHLMQVVFDKILQIKGVAQTETFISLLMAFERPVDIEIDRP
ncbi:MAG: Lrp/AsnC ligand binding domain-containing protein [Rikenellaceae bacterium]|jgi:Lrp/AsnC family transcriptional regulator for asnA, asnC and gidA|nr:Lrp/AsnC ligand binding domain-containing protein [Rikenellaceae bacterium]